MGIVLWRLWWNDEKIGAFHSHLKANDFAHLNNTIEALTFTLMRGQTIR